MSELESQKRLIHESDWDALIILDACRFDYFEEVYREYLSGKLREVKSPASCTRGWLRETFAGKDLKDTVYVTVNPFVRSIDDINLDEVFYKIIDSWKNRWNEEEGTVLPESIGKDIRKVRMKNPKKKIIGHFVQPHYPYLSLDTSIDHLDGVSKKDGTEGLRKELGLMVEKVIGAENTLKLRRILGMSSKGVVGKVKDEIGLENFKTAYRNNLKLALEEVESLSNRLPGKMRVSSDHGELQGEGNLYGHYPRFERKELRNVPWLEVDN